MHEVGTSTGATLVATVELRDCDQNVIIHTIQRMDSVLSLRKMKVALPGMRRRLLSVLIAIGTCSGMGMACADAPDGIGEKAGSNPRAMIASAIQYENAEGVPRDYDKAAALYCKAAKLGDADAQYALGWMYANGRGVPRDDAVAAQIFSLAADRGHPGAQTMRRFTLSAATAPLPRCLLPDATTVLLSTSTNASNVLGPPMDAAYFKGPIYATVKKLAERSGIDPKLVMAVILVESGFNPRAVSPKNAQGLMQLIPETAQRFQVKDAFNPEDNIRGGIAYLKWLLSYFKGDVALVAAAYNAGEGTVQKYRGVPPYPETQRYVLRISRLYQKVSHPYSNGLTGTKLLN